MEKMIQVRCKNNGKTIEVPVGSNLKDIYEKSGLEMKYGPLSAHVNNKVEGMHYRGVSRHHHLQWYPRLHPQPVLRALQGSTRTFRSL